MPSSDLNTDIYLCVGFGLAFAGVVFSQIWWIFGGTLIFISPFMGEVFDKHTVKSKGVRTDGKEDLQDASRPEGWEIPHWEEERRRDQERILLRV
jgi:hypothetical protein